ncbi:MAG TPA: hypothetical protein VKU02_17105 [Gemmataceae bacterium]|nr:hypothetical protein [Gemmataceae bacterium]
MEADLDAVVLRCLGKVAAERFPNAEALQQALLRCRCASGMSEAEVRHWRQAGREHEA